ncbi:hypothetical protein [Listeria booriae]|uniref:hypothetical protein n=1 Tax=Listeria booriae TaxID=1552123 RepID=UPI00163DA5E1|nr:hypothetical protein [Listeria booriae]MBC1308850.1 hypothetical protein [Listeria booriae]
MEVALVSMCTSIIVSAVGGWFFYSIEKKKQFFALKIQARAEMVEEWKGAHLGLYKAVLGYKRYIELFTEQGNEYKQFKDIQDFFPLEKFASLDDFINDNSIFFSKNLTIHTVNFLRKVSILNGIALAYSSDGMKDIPFPIKDLEKSILESDKLLNIIKSELGLSKISFNK